MTRILPRKPSSFSRWPVVLAALAALLAPLVALANPEHPTQWQLNLTRGVSGLSHDVWDLHMAVLWVCVGIGVVVYGVLVYSLFKFRKSKGAQADTKFTHHTVLEVVWTTIPVLILIGLAYPATRLLIYENNTTGSQLTIKVTGIQWMWRYDYLSYLGQPIQKVGFVSKLAESSNVVRQMDSTTSPWSVKDKHGWDDYLLNVDHELVVPTHTKIQFVITAADVIHGFWVPALGWQADAVPGQIHDAWGKFDKPGTYRGQCAQLCGQDHAYMPIVIKAVPRAQFQQWLADQENKARMEQISRTAQLVPTGAFVPQG